MAKVSTADFRQGLKIEMDGNPFLMIANQFVKPGKGNAFNRTRLKNMLNGRVVEKTWKSGETVEIADVEETKMRMLYQDQDGAVFMNDDTFDQITVPHDNITDVVKWLMDDIVYDIIFYKGEAVSVEPPTFLDMKIAETAPGVKGDTASGRVLKPATTESGANIQVPIFIEEGELIKVDTRTGEYVSRSKD